MRQFPEIRIDVSLEEMRCRICLVTIPAFNPIYHIPQTLGSVVVKTCCEGCAYREIDRRIAIVKDECAMERERDEASEHSPRKERGKED